MDSERPRATSRDGQPSPLLPQEIARCTGTATGRSWSVDDDAGVRELMASLLQRAGSPSSRPATPQPPWKPSADWQTRSGSNLGFFASG